MEDDVDLYRELEIDEVRRVVFFIGPNEAKWVQQSILAVLLEYY